VSSSIRVDVVHHLKHLPKVESADFF
jgi:hypothetical protein